MPCDLYFKLDFLIRIHIAHPLLFFYTPWIFHNPSIYSVWDKTRETTYVATMYVSTCTISAGHQEDDTTRIRCMYNTNNNFFHLILYMYQLKILMFACERFGKWKRTSSNQKEPGQFKICGFLLEEVINPKGEFHADYRITVGWIDQNRDDDDD